MSIPKIKNHNKLSVIIPTFNSGEYIHTCIFSLKESLNMIGMDHEIIVIDNNSNDSTVDVLEREENVSLLKLSQNVGFAKSVNMGIRRASGNLFLILNPDTRPQKASLINLHKCMMKSGSGIVGGLSYRRDRTIHGSFVRKPSLLTLLFDYSNLRKIVPGDVIHKQHYYQDRKVPNDQMYVDIVSGSFMMIDKKVVEKIGYFDENFFMYLEDVDFCVRALKENIVVSLCPESKIFHEGGASSKNEDRILHSAWDKSRRYYSKKHFGFISNMIIQPIFVIDSLLTRLWQSLKSR